MNGIIATIAAFCIGATLFVCIQALLASTVQRDQRFSLRQLLMFVTVVSILMGLLVAIHQIRGS